MVAELPACPGCEQSDRVTVSLCGAGCPHFGCSRCGRMFYPAHQLGAVEPTKRQPAPQRGARPAPDYELVLDYRTMEGTAR